MSYLSTPNSPNCPLILKLLFCLSFDSRGHWRDILKEGVYFFCPGSKVHHILLLPGRWAGMHDLKEN